MDPLPDLHLSLIFLDSYERCTTSRYIPVYIHAVYSGILECLFTYKGRHGSFYIGGLST